MKALDLAIAARWAGGSLLRGVPSSTIAAVTTDSRKPSDESLFVALKGENFDAHDFLESAVESGAVALLVSRLTKFTEDCKASIIRVDDTLAALQSLARNYRQSMSGLRVVGVTGSNGKTSAKDLIRDALGGAGVVGATVGNLNNHIGLPLTILSTEPQQTAAVWEMGMSNPGEIECLAEIAVPDVAVITHIGTAHIEFMKTRDAIAQEKGMLVEAIEADGLVVLNANDDFAGHLAARSKARVITAGIEAGDVRGENLNATADGTDFELVANGQRVSVSLPVAGRHMVGNAVLAAAVAIEFGRDIDDVAKALSAAELTGGRLQRRVVAGLSFLDDSYNANPDSMRAALATLTSIPADGRRIAVLGRMAELGDLEDAEHRQLGEAVAQSDVDVVIGVGEAGALIIEGATAAGADESAAIHCSDQQAVAAFLKASATGDDLILVKGSRSAAMETVIRELED